YCGKTRSDFRPRILIGNIRMLDQTTLDMGPVVKDGALIFFEERQFALAFQCLIQLRLRHRKYLRMQGNKRTELRRQASQGRRVEEIEFSPSVACGRLRSGRPLSLVGQF